MGKMDVSKDGLINDLENQLLRMCEEGFRNHQHLQHMKLNEAQDVNPDDVGLVDLPAIYAWCTGFGVKRNTIVGKGHELARKFEFYCEIQYIMPRLEGRKASKELRKIAWWLFELVDGNLDLNGWVQGDTEMLDVGLYPQAKIIDGKVQPVSQVNIKVIYPFVDRSKTSRLSSKYTSR